MYLVCDGGGTKTEYMLFDLSGHIHGFSKTQGTNAIFINPDAAADAVCGGISVIGGAVAVIHKWISPAIKLTTRVKVLEEHDKRDFETMHEIRERDSLIMETLVTMLNSQISGNNVEQLKETRGKLISYLARTQ